MKQLFVCIFLITIISISGFSQKAKTDSLIKVSIYKIEKKDYYGAIKDLNTASRYDEKNPKIYKLRAMAKNEIKEYRAALDDAHKSVKNSKYFDAETYYLLGQIYVNLKEYESAMGYLNNALNINPQYYEAQNLKALIMYYSEDYKSALNFIESAIVANSEYGDFYLTKAMLLISLQKYPRAINNLDKALSLKNCTNEYLVYLNRGICNIHLLNYEKAIKDINDAIFLAPYNASAYHSRGRAYYEMQAYDAALNDFNKSVQINPDNAVTYYNMGMSYYRLRDKSNACLYFHKGCSLGSKSSCKMVLLNCTSMEEE